MRSLPTVLTIPAIAILLAACERPTPVASSAETPHAALPTPPAQESPHPAANAADARSPAPSPDSLSDAAITTKVRTAILSDPAMAGSDVSVNTDRGVVSLAGVVKSEEQTAIASGHAQRPDGVMRVDNHLAMNLE